MSFVKTICKEPPSKYLPDNNLKLNETQVKYLSILNKIYPLIVQILDGAFSLSLTNEKILLLIKPYNDMVGVYSYLFKSHELTFLADFRPDLIFSLTDFDPDEALNWFDYFREEAVIFGEIISSLIVGKSASTPAEINNLTKRVNELLSVSDNKPWRLTDAKIKKDLEDYKKHWLKGFTFYYRKDDGSVISIQFEKTIRGKSTVGYEFFSIFYNAYQKDKNTLLQGNEVLQELKLKVKTSSEFKDLKSNFNNKVKDTEIENFICIEQKDGGYRLKIKE